jgi:hypothetical protein
MSNPSTKSADTMAPLTRAEIEAALARELRPLQEEARRDGWTMTWELAPNEVVPKSGKRVDACAGVGAGEREHENE